MLMYYIGLIEEFLIDRAKPGQENDRNHLSDEQIDLTCQTYQSCTREAAS